MKIFLGFLILLLVWPRTTSAADLHQIFGPKTQASPKAVSVITSWLTSNCKDLSWAVDLKEIPARYETCGGTIEKVHLEVQLSHQRGEIILWVSRSGLIDGIYEEWPSWRLCSYSDSLAREERTCRAVN